MNTRSIRFRLIAWYAGLLMGVFVLLGGAIYAGLKSYLEQSLSDSQVRRARQIADSLLVNIGKTGEEYVVNEINSWFSPETNDRFIRITRQDESVLYLSKNSKNTGFDASQVPSLEKKTNEESWRREVGPDGHQLIIGAVPCISRNGSRFFVEVGASEDPIAAVLHRLIILLAVGLTVMVGVAVIGGYFLVRKALAPVEKITRTAEQITLHNLKERLPIAETGDELQRLAISLNQMITRLEDAFRHNHRFMADASHELRTPLTIMRGELESIVEHAESAEAVQNTSASVLEEVERLTRIVEGLFAISRLDAGEAQQEWVHFDLAKLATTTTDQMCLLAEDKGISISCLAPREVMVQGDRARMKQVVVNLLDNAIKYTPSGGRVRLTVTAANGRAMLEVDDNGIGIPADARPHIFERFFRVEKARSREMGGAGLGLSIVKSICVAHGGKVDFQSQESVGSRFKVELPLATAPSHGKSGHPGTITNIHSQAA